MPGGTVKQDRLKDNYDQALARSKQEYIKEYGHSMPKEREDMEKKEFRKALKHADEQLPYVWNDDNKDTKPDDFKRPSLGFFGGVNFDKNGKIIR